RPQYLHGLRAILDLRLLVLLRNDDAGGDVCDANGGIGGVDALAAGPARAEGVDAQVLLVDLNVDLFGLRQHGDGGGRRMNTSAALGRRHTLHPWPAPSVFQLVLAAATLNGGDHPFEAAAPVFARR